MRFLNFACEFPELRLLLDLRLITMNELSRDSVWATAAGCDLRESNSRSHGAWIGAEFHKEKSGTLFHIQNFVPLVQATANVLQVACDPSPI